LANFERTHPKAPVIARRAAAGNARGAEIAAAGGAEDADATRFAAGRDAGRDAAFAATGAAGFSAGAAGADAAGFGAAAFGDTGFGAAAFGDTGFGAAAFGDTGFGAAAFGDTGFGAAAFGDTGFGDTAAERAAVVRAAGPAARFRGGATDFLVGTTRCSQTGHTVAPSCNSAPQFVHCMAQVPLGRSWRGVPRSIPSATVLDAVRRPRTAACRG
jgi:PPE-repeat protein